MSDRPEYLSNTEYPPLTNEQVADHAAVERTMESSQWLDADVHTLALEVQYHREHDRQMDALRATCPTCDGLGYITSPGTSRRGGAGGMTITHFDCDNCDGSGRLTVEATFKLLADALGTARQVINLAAYRSITDHIDAVLASLPKEGT